jgi:queuine/archaeosine tRNA-ribosyltransferase
MRRAREAIVAGTFEEFRAEFTAHYTENKNHDDVQLD